MSYVNADDVLPECLIWEISRTVVPEGAGSNHRNHCPNCLYSLHVDIEPGDRESECGGHMEPVSVWVRNKGEWAIIHRCKTCGTLSSNRVAADDNPMKLMSITSYLLHPSFWSFLRFSR